MTFSIKLVTGSALGLMACMSLASCKNESGMRTFESCWSVNELSRGDYVGEILIISSMHGYIIHSRECAPRTGINKYIIKPRAAEELLNYRKSGEMEFANLVNVSAKIEIVEGQKTLIISKINSFKGIVKFDYSSLRSSK